MKYASLVIANLFRKKIRLTLTLGSFFVALFLFGMLAAIRGAFNQGVDVAGADRLVVINRTSLISPVPLSYRDKIMQIKGVKLITHMNWFGGVYQDPKNFFPKFAIDVENQRQVFPELQVPDAEWDNFVKDRQGAVVGASMAKRFGWKVGDRIPIKGDIFPGDWQFNLDAIYHGKDSQQDETQMWFQWDYFQERVPERNKGLVGWYTLRVDNPDDSGRIAREIDDKFANSSYETKTETEKSFATGFVKQLGNIQFLIITIGSVVFFTLLLITGNTMAIAVRERTGEFAVLKAVGFSDNFVLLFVMAESLLISLIGGGLGIVAAKVIAAWRNPVPNVLPYFKVPNQALIMGFALALTVGLISGIIPAIGAMRLRVVDALRRV
jgi:putative ABC transport system permease protein